MSTNTADLVWLSMLALLGAALGVVLFFRGFRMLQYKRLILNTPFSKIRSASIGLVEVSGAPTGPKTISSAITGSPCFYYRARGWQWMTSEKGGGSWKQVVDESVFVPFFLDDGTGNVLVNPQGATLDVHRSFYDDFPLMSVVGKSSIVPESIRKFVATRGLMGGEKVRLEEHIIKPGYPLFVFGALGENSAPNSWNPHPHVSGKKTSLVLHLGGLSNVNVSVSTNISGAAVVAPPGAGSAGSGGKTEAFLFTTNSDDAPFALPNDVVETLRSHGMHLPTGQIPVTKAVLSKGGPSFVTQLAGPEEAGTEAAPASVSPVGVQDAPSLATGASSPAFDLNARVALGKGERGDPFTISSQSQREVVQTLAWKTITCIWGGPVFALICLYCLMVCWGWI